MQGGVSSISIKSAALYVDSGCALIKNQHALGMCLCIKDEAIMLKKMKLVLATSVAAILGACGGGGSDGGVTAPTPVATELEGTWIYSSYSKTDTSTCRIDLPGQSTSARLVFTLNQFKTFDRNCVVIPTFDKFTGKIVPGFLGTFVDYGVPASEGTFKIGGIYVTSGDPTQQMREIDYLSSNPRYGSYNLVGNVLTLSTPTTGFDGTSPSKRSFNTANTSSFPTVAFVKQVVAAP